jgi:hypothetical protein
VLPAHPRILAHHVGAVVQHEDQCLLDVDFLLQVLSQLSFAMVTRTHSLEGHEIENESVNDDEIHEIMSL